MWQFPSLRVIAIGATAIVKLSARSISFSFWGQTKVKCSFKHFMGFRQRVSATLLTSGNACELKIHISSKTWIFENEICPDQRQAQSLKQLQKSRSRFLELVSGFLLYTKFEQKNVLEILFSCFIVHSSGPVTIKSLHEKCKFTCRLVSKGTRVWSLPSLITHCTKGLLVGNSNLAWTNRTMSLSLFCHFGLSVFLFFSHSSY